MKYFVSFLFVSVIAVSAYVLTSLNSLEQSTAIEKTEQLYVLEMGSNFHRVLSEVSQLGYLESNLFIKLYAKATGYNAKIKAGEYSLTPSLSQLQVLELLTTGKSKDMKVTFQEGLNIHDMAKILESKGLYKYSDFLNVVRDKKFVKEILGKDLPSFEGYLFPETYFLSKNTTVKALIKKMVHNFFKNYELSLSGAQMKLDRTTHVVLASMIEKETGAPEERNLISSVFHNRIGLKMRLQSDPTILYGIFDKTGIYPSNIRKKDILEKTRYNTYAVPGLPYGPIANPGLASLKAAVNPVPSKKLYFVSRNDGTHVFSETLKQHNTAVRKFQMDPRARQGKSWRDRTKRK